MPGSRASAMEERRGDDRQPNSMKSEEEEEAAEARIGRIPRTRT